jgi:hypothetical protein
VAVSSERLVELMAGIIELNQKTASYGSPFVAKMRIKGAERRKQYFGD